MKKGKTVSTVLSNPKEALVFAGDKIVYVGSNAGAASHESGGACVVDLKWKTVLPGIHDTHMHPSEAESPILGACQMPGNTRYEQLMVNRSITVPLLFQT